MNKKELFFDEAEQLYVVEQMSIRKTAARLRLAPSTIFKWKKAGDWGKKREELIKTQSNMQKEIFELGGRLLYMLMKLIKKD
nr:hypothetical protein 4 [bacterium]